MSKTELKSDILNLVTQIEDESLLSAIRILLLKQVPSAESGDFWSELPISVQKDIETAIKEADEENFFPHKDIIKEMRKKYQYE